MTLLLASFIPLGVVLLRAWKRGEPASPIKVTLCALLVVATLSTYMADRAQLAKYSKVASAIAGRSADVQCDGLFGGILTGTANNAGYVPYDRGDVRQTGRTIHLSKSICAGLSEYVRGGHTGPDSNMIVAVHVLTHEAVHVAGERNEAKTECVAVQRNAEVASGLGASRENALKLSHTYWVQGYPAMRSDYRDEERCKPGGEWDQSRSMSPWNQD